MLITIQDEILERYPEVQIGYLVAKVKISKIDPFVEKLKKGLSERVEKEDLNLANYVLHPNISIWRKIYEEDMGVKAKTYRSSIEALLRRVLKGKGLWNICNIVDLYNCVSIMSLLPMGGYDLDRVKGDIEIRYGKEGESFLALGEKKRVDVKPSHIVYADAENVMCWLWNHKDSAITSIGKETKTVLFFIDGFDHEAVNSALQHLSENLKQIHGIVLESGILNRSISEAVVNSEAG